MRWSSQVNSNDQFLEEGAESADRVSSSRRIHRQHTLGNALVHIHVVKEFPCHHRHHSLDIEQVREVQVALQPGQRALLRWKALPRLQPALQLRRSGQKVVYIVGMRDVLAFHQKADTWRDDLLAVNEGIVLSERLLPAFVEQSHIVMYVGVGILLCQRAQQMVRSFHLQDGVIYLIPMFPAVRLA